MGKTYCLSEFDLNKQSLKRKLKDITHPCWKLGLEGLLDKRGSKYSLEEIIHLVDGFYSGAGVLDNIKSKQPLSIYYSLQNKEKYEKLKTLIEIKKTGSIEASLKKDVEKLIQKSHDMFMDFEDLSLEYGKLSDKYGVTRECIGDILTKIETEWFEKSLYQEELDNLEN